MDDNIRRALTQLSSNDKTPTLAQLKGKLGPQAYPLPVLIQALQQWKVAPQPLTEPLPEAPATNTTPTLAELQQQVEALRQEVAELRAELARLIPR